MNDRIIKVAVGIAINGSDVLLCQRKSTARYPLKWEFPGGKLEPGESVEACLRREMMEELDVHAEIGSLYYQQHYVYPDSGSFDVYYHLIPSFTGKLQNKVFESFTWTPIADLKSFDILEGNREVVAKLMHDYGNGKAD